jgi:hypothetical protein
MNASTSRRGFLGALLASPALAALPALPVHEPSLDDVLAMILRKHREIFEEFLRHEERRLWSEPGQVVWITKDANQPAIPMDWIEL